MKPYTSRFEIFHREENLYQGNFRQYTCYCMQGMHQQNRNLPLRHMPPFHKVNQGMVRKESIHTAAAHIPGDKNKLADKESSE